MNRDALTIYHYVRSQQYYLTGLVLLTFAVLIKTQRLWPRALLSIVGVLYLVLHVAAEVRHRAAFAALAKAARPKKTATPQLP